MSILDKDWKYTTAAESAKPGYLKRRFAAIRREQREQAELRRDELERISKVVRPMTRRA